MLTNVKLLLVSAAGYKQSIYLLRLNNKTNKDEGKNKSKSK